MGGFLDKVRKFDPLDTAVHNAVFPQGPSNDFSGSRPPWWGPVQPSFNAGGPHPLPPGGNRPVNPGPAPLPAGALPTVAPPGAPAPGAAPVAPRPSPQQYAQGLANTRYMVNGQMTSGPPIAAAAPRRI